MRICHAPCAPCANPAAEQVDVLELDVQLTKDGHVVVFHDKELSRLFGEKFRGKAIEDVTYEELPALRPSGKPTRVPLLASVFSEFSSSCIQVDIKAATPGEAWGACLDRFASRPAQPGL
jgi:glycerophosphoryl diester phosphodiesterase